ncbi:MAG: SDR family oxidoreductase [Thaumarchaeota archaeon]|nr:SDR family oxidoreductase [Nitrososphaerota archaeon]
MSSEPMLHGKKTIVTGAGKGIGRETALAIARSGADVCAASRNSKELRELVCEIKKYHVNAVGVRADVSEEIGAAKIVSEAQEKLGGVDAVICVAGFPMLPELWNKSMQDLTSEDLLNVFKVDVLGSFLVIKQALPIMVKQRSGVIILFSATPAIAGYEKGGAYAVAKAANLGLMKSLAAEYGKYNIRAYAIAPGNIKTARTFDQLSKKERKTLENEPPMKRWGEPKEVASVIVSLVSDKMSFVTGQTVVVDGGTVMS